ncbi:hypothetical protein [Streptomyces sp. NPDC015242]|uniref:hypothetical protein n=1 Tax=Streptomyces sp. NPDC015242 TaxID=3364951 RepID=UPI0036FA753E
MTRLRIAKLARLKKTSSVRRKVISMEMPAVVRSWPKGAEHDRVEDHVQGKRAVTPEVFADHAAALGTHDTGVIFLCGQDHAALLRPAIPPPTRAPVRRLKTSTGASCKRARENPALREAWWTAATDRTIVK